jgi:choline dehydrogenase
MSFKGNAMKLQFDYVIIGAGSAGCVLAKRLSENGKYTVAILEAGGNDDWIWFHIPVGYLYAIGNPRADWLYKTQSEAGLNGRVLNYPRGKVIGGSSSINAMIYMRGQREDYDTWGKGWDWESVLPFFMRQEDSFLGKSEHHNVGGEWRVEEPRVRWEVLDAFQEALAQQGVPKVKDFNTGNNEGSSYFHVNQKKGWRWSSSTAFLKDNLDRKNLWLYSETYADTLVLEGKRVKGVKAVRRGETIEFEALKETIISTGAVATPALLERSGIGQPSVIKALGLEVQHELAGVGENLQDHLQIRPIYKVQNTKTMNVLSQSWLQKAKWGLEFALYKRGPLTMAPSQLGAFTKSSTNQTRANVQFHVQPLSLDKFGDPLHKFNAITVSVCNVQPTSRGSIHAASTNLQDMPLISPNYLSSSEDKEVAIDSLKLARRVMSAQAMQRFVPEEYKPSLKVQSDEDMLHSAGELGTTIFHPVGTAKMGEASDSQAVVGLDLKIHGLQGLRIVDASVMPNITSGNTNSPTMMIAEKASAMILAEV